MQSCTFVLLCSMCRLRCGPEHVGKIGTATLLSLLLVDTGVVLSHVGKSHLPCRVNAQRMAAPLS